MVHVVVPFFIVASPLCSASHWLKSPTYMSGSSMSGSSEKRKKAPFHYLESGTNLPSPSIWALSRSIHATTSFDATIAVPGEIYSRGMNSLPHRNWRSVDAFSETRQTEWFLSARATRHSELGSTADNCSHTDRRRGSRIARREASSAG